LQPPSPGESWRDLILKFERAQLRSEFKFALLDRQDSERRQSEGRLGDTRIEWQKLKNASALDSRSYLLPFHFSFEYSSHVLTHHHPTEPPVFPFNRQQGVQL